MKAEAAGYLAKARQCLDEAKQIAEVTRLYDIIAREAYFAAYHAAAAYVFERTGKSIKTHRGLRSEFSRLARDEPRIGREYLTFLARAYEYKSIADYGVGPLSPPIATEDASSAIETAGRLIDCVAALLSG
jgi:uncharacterized protein (UPF0332 family)